MFRPVHVLLFLAALLFSGALGHSAASARDVVVLEPCAVGIANGERSERSCRVEQRYRRAVTREAKAMHEAMLAQMPDYLRDFIRGREMTARLPPDFTERYPISVQGELRMLAVLYDPADGKPLAKCWTPCELPGKADDAVPVLLLKRGNIVTTAVHRDGADPHYVGSNTIAAAKSVGQCAAEYDRRDPLRADADAEPCHRTPPIMPPNATRSGHCQMQFDVTADGFVENLVALSCSDPVFRNMSLYNVHHWFYHPAWSGGQRVARTAVETKITFRLADESGELIPE